MTNTEAQNTCIECGEISYTTDFDICECLEDLEAQTK